MKDTYPDLLTLPSEWLVPPQLQPDYLTLPGTEIHPFANLGVELSDAHIRAGHGGDIAVVHHESGEHLTYAELAQRSDRAAAALLSLGIRAGSRVALRSANRPELVIASLAAWKIGAVVVPTPAQARAAELAYLLDDTEPALLITSGHPESLADVRDAVADRPGLQVVIFGVTSTDGLYRSWDVLVATSPPVPTLPRVSADAVAVVWHTGGTTGRPKGCYHTHRRFLLGGYAIGQACGTTHGEVWAAAAPMGHALGFIYHTIYTLLHGATIVLIEDFTNPETVLQAIEQHRVGTFTAIAATWARLSEVLETGVGADLSSLRRAFAMWQSTSSSDVTDGWRARGVELLNNFGSTAFATWVLVPRGGEQFPQASLGRAAPGYDVTAVDPQDPEIAPVRTGTAGRLAVRGPTGLTYWRRPELQARDVVGGATLVDDLICIDDAGYATYLGRTDYLISTAGHKVAPVEVEAALSRHPAVREVAVLGLPDSLRQQVVAAFVALRNGYPQGEALRRELQDHVKRELSPYKYPRRLEFVEELPRDHVGKVQAGRLRDRALEAVEAQQ